MGLFRRIRRCISNRRGSAFIVVLLLVLILSVLGMSMMGLAASNMQMSDMDRNYQSVFYIAESGCDQEVEALSDVVAVKCNGSASADEFFGKMNDYFDGNYPKEITVFDEQFGETTMATVSVEYPSPSGKSRTYTLVSEGEIGGVKRKVASDITLQWQDLTVETTPTPVETPSTTATPTTQPSQTPATTPPPNVAVPNVNVALFSIGSLYMTGSAGITGSVGTNNTQPGGIHFEWSTGVNGDFYISPNANAGSIFYAPNAVGSHYGSLQVMEEEPQYPLPIYPTAPDLPMRGDEELAWNHNNVTINQDGHYSRIQTNSYTLNIDVGDGIRELVVDNLIVNGSGRVNVIGSGLLKLYVNNFTLSGSSTFNAGGNANHVAMYYGGSNTFQVDGATQFVGSVYVRSANVSINGSGGVTGHIITGGGLVDITGNASALVRVIYAPNALVRLSGSGHVRGAVVANRCEMSGGTWITYDANANLGDFPGVIGGGNASGGDEPGTGPIQGGSDDGDGGNGNGGNGGNGSTVNGGTVSVDVGKLVELDYTN